MKRLSWVVIGAFLLVSASIGSVMAEDKVLTMSTTTSTESSGLLDVLLPEFKKDTGIDVKVLAKGTGAALKDGMDGNVDVVFVHAKQKEAEFVEKGFGTQRYAVMHNDFIIVGPASDPAGIKGSKNVIEAMKKIVASQVRFISRGDNSGTDQMEQAYWKDAGMKPIGKAYVSAGLGMGEVLTMTAVCFIRFKRSALTR